MAAGDQTTASATRKVDVLGYKNTMGENDARINEASV